MGLDVYLYRYTGERTIEEDMAEMEEHGDHLENEIWSAARREVAGEPVKVMEDGIFGMQETEKKLTDDEYKAIDRLVKARQIHYIEQNNLHLQVGEYGVEIPEEKTELDSEKYPEHMFKIGYMRSSYNSGGFNHVVEELVGHDLYWLFGVDGVDEYRVMPNWNTASTRCQMLIDQLGMDPGYSVMRIQMQNMFDSDFVSVGEAINERDSLKRFMGITEDIATSAEDAFVFDGFQMWPCGKTLMGVVKTEEGTAILLRGDDGMPYAHNPKSESLAETALAVFHTKLHEYNEKKEKHSVGIPFDSFSCKDGDFFLNGVEVRGFCFSCGYGGGRCVDFIQYNPEGNQWYYEAAVIVKEMIEWVLAKDDPSEYYFHWSG